VALWTTNRKVYGARKLWKAARRAGHELGRDQVTRLMKAAGIEGWRKGKKRKTTRSDPEAPRHPDLVERRFVAERPNALWVSDLTYVATWSGFAYAYFIVDAFSRMIVGWRVAANMRTDMVLDALEMARWKRDTTLEGLISHTDAGSQFTSIRYGEHLADLDALPSSVPSATRSTTRSPSP
jgi:putative transposase